MKYMVMECHLSYAVVLDEEGRFLKVANRQYEVGQTVTNIIEMQVPQSAPQKKKTKKWMYSLAAMAACLVLMATSMFQMGQMTYASVYMTINPEVRIDVTRNDVVVGVDGINPDGNDLIEDYEYKKKDLDLVVDELVDRAIDMGYLHEGGQISLVLDADSDEWIVVHSDALTTQLNEHLNEKLSVTIEVTDTKEQSNQAVIPVAPEERDYSESDYGETDRTPIPPVSSQPAESDFNDAQSNYEEAQSDDTDYENQSEYDSDDREAGGTSDYKDDGQSDYSSDTDNDDSQSDYREGSQSDYDDDGSDYDDD